MNSTTSAGSKDKVPNEEAAFLYDVIVGLLITLFLLIVVFVVVTVYCCYLRRKMSTRASSDQNDVESGLNDVKCSESSPDDSEKVVVDKLPRAIRKNEAEAKACGDLIKTEDDIKRSHRKRDEKIISTINKCNHIDKEDSQREKKLANKKGKLHKETSIKEHDDNEKTKKTEAVKAKTTSPAGELSNKIVKLLSRKEPKKQASCNKRHPLVDTYVDSHRILPSPSNYISNDDSSSSTKGRLLSLPPLVKSSVFELSAGTLVENSTTKQSLERMIPKMGNKSLAKADYKHSTSKPCTNIKTSIAANAKTIGT